MQNYFLSIKEPNLPRATVGFCSHQTGQTSVLISCIAHTVKNLFFTELPDTHGYQWHPTLQTLKLVIKVAGERASRSNKGFASAQK